MVEIKEYNGKNGKSYSIKLQDIPLLGSIVVTKMFDKTFEKTGQFGLFYKATAKYNDTVVDVIFSPTQNSSWSDLPIGDVKITKGVKEVEYNIIKDGKEVLIKKPINVYSFESVTGATAPVSLSDKEKSILKYYVANNKKPEDKFILEDKEVKFVDFFGLDVLNNASNLI